MPLYGGEQQAQGISKLAPPLAAEAEREAVPEAPAPRKSRKPRAKPASGD